MKIIILILLFSLTLFANTEPCKLHVYYGNGVWNDSDQAEESMEELKTFMQINNQTRFPVADDGVAYDFKYAHNETYGYINDLIETYWQLYESGQISESYFSFTAKALDGVDNTNPNDNAYLQRIQNIINAYNLDVSTMIKRYRENSLDLKHNVLLVAHSQGNLFGNQMYDLLTAEEKDRFKMVSVATPANNVTGDYSLSAPYTTVKLDYVMIIIKNSFPVNAYGFGHSFVDSYLNSGTLATRVKINSDIANAVNLLDQNSCPQYKYFRWISYMCQTRQDTELEVDIYGSKIINDYGMIKEELVESDVRKRISLQNGSCPLNGWDYRTGVRAYDKNGCYAYTFDDTSYRSLDSIAAQTYDNVATCTQYNMDSVVTEKLRSLQK
ncbi:MAG: hypothetical protein L3I99_04950 [Sulfurimonas sp.]|nr:hypothetical protein [Sulfurimonas sp.]